MKHKTLEQLYNKVQQAKSEEQLEKICVECGWHNCAIGTFLLERGIDISKSRAKYQTVRNLLRPHLVKQGMRWNSWLTPEKKSKALEFIRELQDTTFIGALRLPYR